MYIINSLFDAPNTLNIPLLAKEYIQSYWNITQYDTRNLVNIMVVIVILFVPRYS